MGYVISQSRGSRQTPCSGEPTGRLQTPDPAEKRPSPPVHGWFSGLMGDPVEVSGPLGGLGPSHAAGNSEEVAHHGIPLLLALEVPEKERSTVHFSGDAGPDPQTES